MVFRNPLSKRQAGRKPWGLRVLLVLFPFPEKKIDVIISEIRYNNTNNGKKTAMEKGMQLWQ